MASTSPSDLAPSLGYTLSAPRQRARAHRRRHPHLLRGNRDFRYLFAARLVSPFGDWFNTLAVLALCARSAIRAQPTPRVVILGPSPPWWPPSPAWWPIACPAGRSSWQRMSCVQQLCWACCSRRMSSFVRAGRASGMASAFFEPARTALLPDIVREEHRSEVVGAAAWSTMLALGAGIGGIVTAYLGWSVALSLDVLTYLVSAALFRVTVPTGPPTRPTSSNDWRTWTGLRDIQSGFTFCATTRAWRPSPS